MQLGEKYGGYDGNFNHIINNLPETLEELIFGDESRFNQSLDFLPCNLKSLKISGYYNSSIDNLPNSLTKLSFGPRCTYDIHCPLCLIDGIEKLPNGLKKFIIEEYGGERVYDFSDLEKLNLEFASNDTRR